MAEGITFNFNNFIPGDRRIILQGSAKILPDGVLALTSHEYPSWNTGRALFADPIPIWDSTTGKVASFIFSFSFVVKDIPGSYPADGIVFFLAPNTTFPNNSSGGNLGIVDGNTAFNQFVGVEFDSFVNPWDPDHAHIGIDVNSLISLKTVNWDRVSGSVVNVRITYTSPTKTLGVDVTDGFGHVCTVTQVVDLKAVLPEKVTIGFSATTAGGQETHDILSCNFTSNWE